MARFGRRFPITPLVNTFPGGVTCALSGTALTDTIDEEDVVAGGKTIILTLTGDTFVTGTASEDGIAGGTDSNIFTTGVNWDGLVKNDLDNTDVVLSTTTVTNDTATITLPPYGTYVTENQETITVTIPAASLTGGVEIIASPTFTVDAVASGLSIPVAMHHYTKNIGAI